MTSPLKVNTGSIADEPDLAADSLFLRRVSVGPGQGWPAAKVGEQALRFYQALLSIEHQAELLTSDERWWLRQRKSRPATKIET